MAEAEKKRDDRGERRRAVYDHESSGRHREREPERKPERKESKDGGKEKPKGESVHERHARERGELHQRHRAERRDMHGNHRTERDQMHARHEKDHQDLADRQMDEVAQGGAVPPQAGGEVPEGAAPPAAVPASAA